MQIKKIITGEIKSNCYIISTERLNCVIIDPGADFDKINNYIVNNNLIPQYVLLTHGHYDHIGAVTDLKEKYPDVEICISSKDKDCLVDGTKSLADKYGGYIQKPINSTIIITNNYKINIDEINIVCLLTPGHTCGGVCFLLNNEFLFTGDTLFKASVGRTDLGDGNEQHLKESIRKIYSYFNNSTLNKIIVYPGHGFATNLQKEKNFNHFVNEFLL